MFYVERRFFIRKKFQNVFYKQSEKVGIYRKITAYALFFGTNRERQCVRIDKRTFFAALEFNRNDILLFALTLDFYAFGLGIQRFDQHFYLMNAIFFYRSSSACDNRRFAVRNAVQFGGITKRGRGEKRRIVLFCKREYFFRRFKVGSKRLVDIGRLFIRQHFFGITEVFFGIGRRQNKQKVRFFANFLYAVA